MDACGRRRREVELHRADVLHRRAALASPAPAPPCAHPSLCDGGRRPDPPELRQVQPRQPPRPPCALRGMRVEKKPDVRVSSVAACGTWLGSLSHCRHRPDSAACAAYYDIHPRRPTRRGQDLTLPWRRLSTRFLTLTSATIPWRRGVSSRYLCSSTDMIVARRRLWRGGADEPQHASQRHKCCKLHRHPTIE